MAADYAGPAGPRVYARGMAHTKTGVLLGVTAGALLVLVGPARAQNVTCNQVGKHVSCSNGQTFFRSGNITLDNQGHVWTNLGNQTLGSQGDLYTRQGNQVFDNRGNSYNIIGKQQVGPSGNKCVQIGTQVFCGR